MDPRPFRVLLWTVAFLLIAELALEVRAVRRGWEGLLLGKQTGWHTATDPTYGPAEDFPFRSLRIRPEDAAEERIWVASSSYGEDVQLLAAQIFPNRLGEHLRAAGLDVQVLNASRAGTYVGSNVEDLARLGPRWRPTRVVLYQMSNDVDRVSEMAAARASAGDSGAAPGQGQAAAPGKPSLVARNAELLTSYKHLKTQITTRLVKGVPLRDALGPRDVAVYGEDVRRFVRSARELGAEAVLCTFATSHAAADLDALPADFERQILSMNMVLSMRGWIDSIGRFNDVLREIAADEQIALVDVAAAVTGRRELFRDFWHFTPEGHDLVAKTIAAALLAE